MPQISPNHQNFTKRKQQKILQNSKRLVRKRPSRLTPMPPQSLARSASVQPGSGRLAALQMYRHGMTLTETQAAHRATYTAFRTPLYPRHTSTGRLPNPANTIMLYRPEPPTARLPNPSPLHPARPAHTAQPALRSLSCTVLPLPRRVRGPPQTSSPGVDQPMQRDISHLSEFTAF